MPLKLTQIIAPGETCYLIRPLDGSLTATVTAIAVYPKVRIIYQVAWWDQEVRRETWVEAHEVKMTADTEQLQIGFAQPPTS